MTYPASIIKSLVCSGICYTHCDCVSYSVCYFCIYVWKKKRRNQCLLVTLTVYVKCNREVCTVYSCSLFMYPGKRNIYHSNWNEIFVVVFVPINNLVPSPNLWLPPPTSHWGLKLARHLFECEYKCGCRLCPLLYVIWKATTYCLHF